MVVLSSTSRSKRRLPIWILFGVLTFLSVSTLAAKTPAATSANLWGTGKQSNTNPMMTKGSKKKKTGKQTSSDNRMDEEDISLGKKKKKGKRKRKSTSSSIHLSETSEQKDPWIPTTSGTNKRKKKVKGRKHVQVTPKTDSRPSLEKVARKGKKKRKSKRKLAFIKDDSLRVPKAVDKSGDDKPAKKKRKVSKKRRQTKVDPSDDVLKPPDIIATKSDDSSEYVKDSSTSLSVDSHNTTDQDDVAESIEFQVEPSNATAFVQDHLEINSPPVENQAEPTDASDQLNIGIDDGGVPDSTKETIYEAMASAESASSNTAVDETNVSFDENQTHGDDGDNKTFHNSEQAEIKDTHDDNEANDHVLETEMINQAESAVLPDSSAEEEDPIHNGESREAVVNTVEEPAEMSSHDSSANLISDENVADESEAVDKPDETAQSLARDAESPETDQEIKDSNEDEKRDDDTTSVELFPSVDSLDNTSENPISLETDEVNSNAVKKVLIDEPEDSEIPIEDIESDDYKKKGGNGVEKEGDNDSAKFTEENGESAVNNQSEFQTGSSENRLDQPNGSSMGVESMALGFFEKSGLDEQDSGETDELDKKENLKGDERSVAEPTDEVYDDDNDNNNDDDDDDKGLGEAELQTESAGDTRIEIESSMPELMEQEETAISSSDSQSALIAETDVKQDIISIETIESFCDDPSDLTCSIVTWNLAEESPAEEEAAFLKQFRGHDIVLISGQECENIKPRRAEGRRSREYRRLMIKYLGSEYVPIALHMLGGIQFGLFCKRSILKDVESVSVADVTCGIGNVFHNKGAIAAFVTLQNKSPAPSLRLLFVTAHMAAHVKNTEARNADFWRIVSELEEQVPEQFLAPRALNTECTGEYLLSSVDRIFFCGDLNYRIDLPREIVEHTIRKAKRQGKLDPEALEKLLRHDQLKAVIAEGLAFPGFAEGKISFGPTFKYDKGTPDFDTSPKQRIPAWTDRVLFKPKGTRVLTYDSVPLASHSDHRPVFASFRVNRQTESKRKKRKRKR